MADTTVTSPAPRKGHGWLRALAWVFGILIVLVVVLYFVATSSAFFKGVILPKVSAALNAKVTVSDASISPFSQVVLHNLKVETTGTEPLVAATEVLVRYNLKDIIGGNLHIDELTLTAPAITLVENPDGTSNLDPILKAQKEKPSQPPSKPPSQPSKPPQLDIGKIALTDGTIRQIKLYKTGTRDLTEISHFNFTVDGVKNGSTGKLAVGADVTLDKNPPTPEAKGALQAKLEGNFTFVLSSDLKPASVQGGTRLAVTRAEGTLAQAAALGAKLDCEVTPTDIKQVVLAFQKGDTTLGKILVSGPFNMEKTEGRLAVQVLNIDKNLLNLAGASSGIDFGPTTINCTNDVQIAKAGSVVTTVGQLNLNQLQLTRTNQTTPPLDLRADYNVTVDQSASNALLRTFLVTGTQKGNQILKGELTSPMTVAWGNTASAVGDSALTFTVAGLNLADWKPFLGDSASAGIVNTKLQLLSQQAGKQLTFDLNSEIANLTAGAGSNQITQATVTLLVNGKASDFKQFNLTNYKFQVARQNQPLVTVSGGGTYDQAAGNADLQLNAQVALAALLQTLPRPDIDVSAGTADLQAHLTQQSQAGQPAASATQHITGTMALANLTGKIGNNTFRSFGTTADLDVAANARQIEIRKVAGKVTEGSSVGGTFELSGAYDRTNQSAQLVAKLADFNQNGLRTFLEPLLTDKKLVSVSLNANATAQYNPQGASAVKADLLLTNLVVNDPKGQFPATPLAAGMALDVSLNKQVADVRQFQISLTPTARATNQVQLTGHIDMTDTNAIQGNLKLTADSLDLTTYCDLFGGGQKAGAAQQPTPAAKPGTTTQTAPSSTGESAPTMKLPVRNFTADASIGRLYLHEIDIANWQTSTKIDGGHVVLNPVKLTFNGAPVSSTVDLDLSVPGYKYSVSLNAQAMPLAPLVNSVKPEYKGILSGTMTAQANINGTGTSGETLQKSLNGQFDIGSTNLNLSVDNLPSASVPGRLLKVLVSAIATIPDLVKNPAGGAASLVQGFMSSGQSGATATPQSGALGKSPIDSIVLRGNMGSGQIAVDRSLIQSPAFRVEAPGTVSLAPVLTNSTINFPINLSLERSVAQKIHSSLVPPNTPPDATYVKLPDFLTEKGTLGVPKMDINKMALLSAVLQGVGGKGGQAGSLLQGLTGALGGGGGTTNAPGTNQAGGLLQGLGGFLGGNAPASTNATTNPPATKQSPVGGFLNQFLKPKK